MRSISVKLTLAFLLVGLVGALLVATLVQFSTRREFGRLTLDQNQQALVTNLTRYYQTTGSWNGVEAVFHPERNTVGQRDQETRWDARRVLFMLADRYW